MKLPLLREELMIHEGPRLHDGQPSWTLHDPARNRFFRLDWLTFEIFQRWSLGDPEIIAGAVNAQTPLRPVAEDVAAVLSFAGANQLLSFAGADNSGTLARLSDRARPSWWQWLIHNYLFFRVPLIKPAIFLHRVNRHSGFLFQKQFWLVTALAAVLGLSLLWREWDHFTATWVDFTDLNGAVGYFLVLVFVKMLHELGHGLAATHFGCHVPTMGLAFLVMTPVAYTDINDSWKLANRRPRVWIGAAGMLAELGLAAWATLAWGVLPEGYFRSAAFMVATVTWVKSVVVNISPIMRFDGYYLLSDGLDLPNLHSRAFALARWQLREWLFDFREQPPEYFSRAFRRGLVALAMFIWLYRLIVFTGIAVFVYHFFFKALGVVLFAVEISWFVALPIFSEISLWLKRRREIQQSRRRWIGGLCLLAAGLGVIIPLPQHLRLMGQLYPERELKITAPETAQLLEIGAQDGTRVAAGQILVRLDSSVLQFRWEKAKARAASLAEEIASAGASPTARNRLPVMETELDTVRATLRDVETAMRDLQPVAPFSGIFRLVNCDLHPGEWVARQEQLASLVADENWLVVAYLNEHYAHLLAEGTTGRLYLDGVPGRAINVKVASIEADASRRLNHPMFTTQFGGNVSSRLVEGDLIPDKAVYRVTLTVEALPAEVGTQIRRGRIVIKAGAESMLTRWSRNLLSVIWRELGF